MVSSRSNMEVVPNRMIILATLISLTSTILVLLLAPKLAISSARQECQLLEERLKLVEQMIEQLNPGRRKRSSDKVEDNQVGPHVEFFNPKVRGELQAKGELAPGGDSWVWLTSYSRIPYQVVQGFCKATQEYCPPGAAGPPGVAGPRGPPGDRGPLGGIGGPGPIGPPGPKGDQGWPGLPGLDGRDGVPGEPGLDGVPGRSGADGAPGNPGKHGTNGADGRNGTDGRPGVVGPPGPAGPIGPKGLTGPRGKSGRPGINGSPGLPGVSTWMHNETKQLLIPPSISGRDGETLVVREGENIKLTCSANGLPKPTIRWTGTTVIRHGAWIVPGRNGSEFPLVKVSRTNSGSYVCTADNGIPPQDNRTIHLEVHFPPLIRIKNQMVPARNGTSVKLECDIEAYPEPVRYWERYDGKLIEAHDRNAHADFVSGGTPYKSSMSLRLTRLSSTDFGQYYCIAKNEQGLTKGVFTLYEQDPMLGTPPPPDPANNEWGMRPPPIVTLEELCPAAPACPTCPRCTDPTISLADLLDHFHIEPVKAPGQIYPGYPPRTTDCVLYAIGKPVYHRYTEQNFGAWMKDPSVMTEPTGEKIWVTNEMNNRTLFEFSTKDEYRTDKATKTYKLEREYVGNGHIVFNGSFYYHAGGRRVNRLELATNHVTETELPSAARPIIVTTALSTSSSATAPVLNPESPSALYSTGHTYMDFNVDDNGLWVIYSLENSNNTAVAKLDPNTLHPQYIWNISINHHKVGEMFITCGVLYAVDSVTERSTKVRLALDLFNNKLLEVSLPFANPFRRTTALGYSHRNKELYSWDRGNQLTYPVRYHEIEQNSTMDTSSLIV